MTTPSLQTAVRQHVTRRLRGMRVAMPATVREYDKATQTVVAQPVFKADGRPLPPVHNVPVQFPSGGGKAITWELVAGDPLLLVFSDRSLEEWLTLGGFQEPADARSHHLSDAIAIAGVRPMNNPLPPTAFVDGSMVLGNTDGSAQAAISATHVHLGSAVAVAPVALAPLVAAELAKIAVILNGLAGPGSYVPSSVAASKVNAE